MSQRSFNAISPDLPVPRKPAQARQTRDDSLPVVGSRTLSLGLFFVLLLTVAASEVCARDAEGILPLRHAFDDGWEPAGDDILGLPAMEPLPLSYRAADTLGFGYVDADGFAVLGEVWTFDHGSSDPLEGWYSLDVTAQLNAYWRHIDVATWEADPENTVSAPVLRGSGSAWVGAFGSESLDLCWESGLGYGNMWCQRLVSPLFIHDGATPVDMNWVHFNDTEWDFDYTLIYLETEATGTRTELRRYTDRIGTDPSHPDVPPPGMADGETLIAAEFGGESEFRIVFEMTSDGGWSDSDGLNTTEYGPAAFDNVSLAGIGPDGTSSALYQFESDLEGWSPEACTGFGSFLGVRHIDGYSIEEPLYCNISGNVLELHNDDEEHDYGQRELAISPRVDVANDVTPYFGGQQGITVISSEWSQYSVLPQANGVFYRPGWMYFPWICDMTGEEGWTRRIGQNTFFFVGEDPACTENFNVGSEVDVPIPPDAEQLRFVFEVYASCDAFAIPEAVCTETTNYTPLVDNVEIRFTLRPEAPRISFDNGLRFQDGFSQATLNLPYWPGNADVTRNRNFGNTPPVVLGDSLYISGPLAGSNPDTQWESKLWFRVPRVGPEADFTYTNWRDKVADGRNIDPSLAGSGPIDFTFAFMDSFEVGTNVANNKYISYFREDDDDFDGGAGDLSEANEIIADGVLYPGTQVEYFVSSNFIGNSQSYLLPDTAGGNFLEFEILPSWRDDDGVLKYPCTLYIDAANQGEQFVIGRALDELGIVHDRYDYLDASSNWKAPMARGGSSSSNNGCTLLQLLGYKAVLINSGSGNITSFLWPEDYLLYQDWLTAAVCAGLSSGQLMVFNGNGLAHSMKFSGAALLNYAGASHLDDSYREFSGDNNLCVQLEAPSSSSFLFDTAHTEWDYDIDAFGSGFPVDFNFDVLTPVGAGVGNRVYKNVDLGIETGYAQIATEAGQTGSNHLVVDGVSWGNLSLRDPVEECTSDIDSTVEATKHELRAIIEWAFGPGFDELDDLCDDACLASDVDGGGVLEPRLATGLHSSLPNPFNPRTELRFTLAEDSEALLEIFDASGRRVRTLVDGIIDAGRHQVVWDGSNEQGQSLPSGVYWARFRAGDYQGSSKLIRLQ